VPFQRSINVFVVAPTVALPTATQLVAVVHDTPLTATAAAPLGVGLATIDQVVPFQRSMSTCGAELFADLPTAMQLDTVEHEMPARFAETAPAGIGMLTIDQLVPFHRSTSGRCAQHVAGAEPTAKQLVVLAQETAESELSDVDGFRLVEVLQLVPFQRSMMACACSEVVDAVPTAKQPAVVAHETELRAYDQYPAGFVVGTVDQVLPFQRSANVANPDAFVNAVPTATQFVDVGHVTAASRA
jgi:hypothetical protein